MFKPLQKLFIGLILLVVFPSSVSAHGEGMPEFFYTNGVIHHGGPLKKVGLTSKAFTVPQDISTDRYYVNQEINFEIGVAELKMVILPEVIEQTHFAWDFGDGTKGEGLTNAHTYTQMGSYIVSITTNFNQPDMEPMVIQSIMIHVLPHEGYQLPQAKITVNGKDAPEMQKGTMMLDLNRELTFDASESLAPSSKISEVIWDFGDGATSFDREVSHTFKPEFSVSPRVQVKDANGFISQAYVDIRNTAHGEKASKLESYKFIPLGGVVALGLIGSGFWVFKKRKKNSIHDLPSQS